MAASSPSSPACDSPAPELAAPWSIPSREEEMGVMTPLVRAAEEFVRAELAGNDGSHDFFHIERVRRTAHRIAVEEGFADVELIDLAALLHDIRDWKYSGDEAAGPRAAAEWLTSQGVSAERIARITSIMEHIGFKNDLERLRLGASSPKLALDDETLQALSIVQDADRLDAIGAMGVARTLTFGGAKDRVIFDPSEPPKSILSKKDYVANTKATTINHFYEKLLHLKGLMRTATGRRIAEGRHAFMEAFLDQFFREWRGEA